jgi:hypothetical protein
MCGKAGGMIERRGVLGLLSASATFALFGCGEHEDPENYRIKLTVEVNTPNGVKVGHSVWQISYGKPSSFPIQLGETRDLSSVLGEAVAVDIGPGETLFALMKSAGGDLDYPRSIVHTALNFRSTKSSTMLTAFKWRATAMACLSLLYAC